MGKKNILFVCPNVVDPNLGGIERVTDVLAKYLKSYGYKVVFLSVNTVPQPPYEYAAEQYVLNKSNDVAHVYEIIKKHNISIVINQNVLSSCSLLTHLPSDIKIITVMHDSKYAMYSRLKFNILRRWRWKHIVCKEMKKAYDVSDRIVLFVPEFIKEFQYFYKKANKDKFAIIPNFNSYDNVNICPKENRLLWVGRHAEMHKRTTDILKIWAKLEDDFPQWSIDVLGDGPDGAMVRKLHDELGLKRCNICGIQDPKQFYEKAAILCMTSSFESFGMVLTEGMQHGCVPIAYDSYTAVRHIIHDENDGVLVKPFEIDEYANKLALLMGNKLLRENLSTAAIKSVKQYDAQMIMPKWIELLESVCE